jgi:acrylyl-CoA reductase (NADPH)
MSSFKALVLEREGEQLTAQVRDLQPEQLPTGDVLIAVEYSSLNYKDGLVLNGLGGLAKDYPHVPGVDYAGSVIHSTHKNFTEGDAVIGTGFRVGEIRWGGYAQQVRVSGDWLVSLPEDLTTKRAMGLGAAGLSAAIALQTLETHGLKPDQGEVLVTGASGGVGSFAVALLAKLGYHVVATTGRLQNSDYLKELGAREIIPRSELTASSSKPLESAHWAACIDSVGGTTLARALAQMKYGASAAAIGLAGGTKLETTVIPFLLRGVNLLGIDSVYYPIERRAEAWQRLAQTIPGEMIDAITSEATLEDLPRLGKEILDGKVKGRVVVDVNRR